MSIIKRSEWSNYKKGEANCYSWKIERVQVKITDSHYINNFVDYVIKENRGLLRNIDKLVLLGNGNPIAIYPGVPEDLNNVCVYLESIKDTDIHTILLSLGEDSGAFVDSDMIEEVLTEINAITRMKVRFILSE